MKLDSMYRFGYKKIHIKAGGVKVKDCKAFAELQVTTTIISWRYLIWRIAELFCSVLDLRLPKPTMVNLKKGL